MKAPLAYLTLVALVAGSLVACTPAAPGAAPAAAPAAKPAAKAAAQPAAKSAPSSDYFAGKTVTLLVNFSAGGPTDIFARLVAQYLDKHIPGKPTLVIENRPGAGGVIGANQLYNAGRRDGLTVGFFSSPFSYQLLEGEGVQYDSAGFLWLAGVNESQVTYAHQSLGVKTPRELLSASQEIVVGGLSPDSAKDLRMRTFLNMLGLRYRYVTGYPGVAEITLAVRRGEINFADDSLTSYATNIVPMIKEGSAFPMAQSGIVKGGQIVRDPRVSDVPTLLEAAVELKGEAVKQTVDWRAMTLLVETGSMLRAIVYPPGTSPELVEVMRQAMADAFADPDLQAQAEKQLGFQFEFVPGTEAQALAEKIVKSASDDPEALDYLRRQAREKR